MGFKQPCQNLEFIGKIAVTPEEIVPIWYAERPGIVANFIPANMPGRSAIPEIWYGASFPSWNSIGSSFVSRSSLIRVSNLGVIPEVVLNQQRLRLESFDRLGI